MLQKSHTIWLTVSTALEMLVPLVGVVVVVALHLSYGQSNHGQSQRHRTVNLRDHCTSQHIRSKYKFSCDGSKHFTDKNLFLDDRSAFDITNIDFYNFESINIAMKTASYWESIKRISIRKCKNVTFSFESTLELNELEIDAVGEFVLLSEQATFSFSVKKIMLSNVGKLSLNYSKNADFKADILDLVNTEVNFYDYLHMSGKRLTISGSKIDVTDRCTLSLKFASITIKESTELYIQADGKINVTTDKFLTQDSNIVMNGQIILTGYELSENRKEVKFINNSFYYLKSNNLLIHGDTNDLEFIQNGIYKSDMSEILDFMGGIKDVSFSNNYFDCNQCTKLKMLKAKNLQYLGDHNVCYLACNLTLTEYLDIFDREQICMQGDSFVDGEKLCSLHKRLKNIKKEESSLNFLMWTVILVVFVSFLSLCSILVYFFCKRRSPETFTSFPVESTRTVVLSPKIQNHQENQNIVMAFSNDTYEQMHNTNDPYEYVESPIYSDCR